MTSPPDDGSHVYAQPPALVTITILLIIFLILAIIFICFCRCCTLHLRRAQLPNPAFRGRAATTGLSPAVIDAFPTFVYSKVKHLRRDADYDLECAICLLEFEDDSILRLLTACYHVFHQDCIDLWLRSNKSCPVCRGDLDLSPEKIQERFPAILRQSNLQDIHEHKETVFEDAVSIDIEKGEEKGRCHSGERIPPINVEKSMEKLPRWNSTGHSIVKDKSESRYTLRLQDNVRVRVTKGHSGSSVTFGALAAIPSNQTFDELSEGSKGKGSIR